MSRRFWFIVLFAALLPLRSGAMGATLPMDFVANAAGAPASSMPCHEVGEEPPSSNACAMCAACYAPAVPAATGSAPRSAPPAAPRTEPARNSGRPPVDRLPRIRPQ